MKHDIGFVQLDVVNQVATIVLNDPAKLNCLSPDLSRDLLAALCKVRELDSVSALVLTGSGRAFSAGADLRDPRMSDFSQPIDLGALVIDLYNRIVELLADLRVPTLAAVNGVAAGAGANLALACDIVLARDSATFLQPFMRLGLTPDTGGTYILPKLVGLARARALTMLAEPISATEAERIGMIWKAVAGADWESMVASTASKLARGPTDALIQTRAALNSSWHNGLAAQLHLEGELIVERGLSADYKEGATAFLEKREPSFM